MAEQAVPLGLPAMRRALISQAELLRVPVTLDGVCQLAGSRWSEAAVAITVPVRVVGAAPAQTVAAADLARAGEELQVTLGEGPSLDVLDGAGAIHLADIADGALTRWPNFVPAAVRTGIRSMTVLPMRIGAARFGTFVVYLRRPGGLEPSEGVEATTLASIALDLLLEHLDPLPHDGALRGSPPPGTYAAESANRAHDALSLVDDRPEIHQATGMVSIQLGTDLPTALLRLRARAFAENRRLSHLAADVVSRVVRFDVEHSSNQEDGRGYDDE
jgi:hypothetical protein